MKRFQENELVMVLQILALDFDGVLCDGLIEYFQTAWQAYVELWQPPLDSPPPGLAEPFYRLRPVVETGWEMPVLLEALLKPISESEILQHWPAIAPQLITEKNLSVAQVGATVDRLRDEWIARDLDGWLAQHRFYPGIIAQLHSWQTSGQPKPIIVTTKEGRFTRQLLQKAGITLNDDQIFGKEVKRPKAQTLRELIARYQLSPDGAGIWFIEDRLKTLQTVQNNEDLGGVQLFLADWGYNTEGDRTLAQTDPRIHRLSLTQFSQDFSQWF